MIEILIYLAFLVDNINNSLSVFFILFVCAVGLNTFLNVVNDVVENVCGNWAFKNKFLLITLFIFATLIPPAKVVYMIAAAHYGKEIAQSAISDKVMTLLNGKLDEEINKLVNKKGE